MKVDFKPKKRMDGRFAVEIFVEGSSRGFLHWIERGDGTMCRISDLEFVKNPFHKDDIDAVCKWLKDAYEKGEIQ